MAYKRRLLKEMQTLLDLSIPGLKFIPTEDGINHWYVDINIVDNPIYDPAHAFRLEIVAGDEYPIEPPMVKFIGQEIPLHPHVYSNGHICLNILGDGWTPAQSIRSIALSIQSMLQGNTKNERPPDDERYISHAPQNPRSLGWVYHDDNV